MSCYHFTYHGHGTWLPDHARGYVRRKVGVLATDVEMARRYRENQFQATVTFASNVHTEIVKRVLVACDCIDVRCHTIATDSSHIHLLLSWKHERTPQSISQSIKSSLTRRLNEKYGRQKWFSKAGSLKRVKDRRHFNH